MSTIQKKASEISEDLKRDLAEIEAVSKEPTLADMMRMGAKHTDQAVGWGDGYATACALTSAAIAARGAGLV